jgi:ornithine cyclodeaminase/alanine dehydrogenase-like protein (mu-crystallin family)
MLPLFRSRHASRARAGRGLLLLSGRDLERLLEPEAAVAALRQTYQQLAANRDDQGKSIGFSVDRGSIHVKAGLQPGLRSVFAAKVNVNLPGNPAANGLPTIQGVVVLMDARDGRPLAIMESMTLTALRTAAAAALAATHGARKESRSVAIIGCGAQALHQVNAMRACFAVQEVRAFDIDTARAQTLAAAVRASGCRATMAASVRAAVEGIDICVTCTTAKSPVLTADMDLAGCFVAAIGADNLEKREIDPALMRRARILVDDREQCAAGGDLAHALRAGLVGVADVHADLADLASGAAVGRCSPSELVIFDSTGSGVQDVAAAQAAYDAARTTRLGESFDLIGGKEGNSPVKP